MTYQYTRKDKALPQVGWLVKDKKGDYRPISHDKLMAFARTYPKGFHYTPEMLDGMFQHQERDYMSPTMLANCPREVVLRRQLDYYVCVDYAWPAYRGTIGHAIMENSLKQEPDAIIEKRLMCEFILKPSGERIILAGTPDKVLPSQGLLVDYKTIQERDLGATKNYWIPQLSAYRWMLLQHGIVITRALIQQVGMMRPHRVELELWDLDRTERWLNARIHQFKGAFDGTYDIERLLPPPVTFLTEPDVAWKCIARNGKPAWCSVQEECFALQEQGL